MLSSPSLAIYHSALHSLPVVYPTHHSLTPGRRNSTPLNSIYFFYFSYFYSQQKFSVSGWQWHPMTNYLTDPFIFPILNVCVLILSNDTFFQFVSLVAIESLIFQSDGFPLFVLRESFPLSCKKGKRNSQFASINYSSIVESEKSSFFHEFSNFSDPTFSVWIFSETRTCSVTASLTVSLFVLSKMKPSTRLDSAVFQLTPTRTRFFFLFLFLILVCDE